MTFSELNGEQQHTSVSLSCYVSLMGVLGIGVDIVHVPRIIRLLERRTPTRLAHRILSEKELSAWNELPSEYEARRIRYLAVRYVLRVEYFVHE